jgi:hypothetical protein
VYSTGIADPSAHGAVSAQVPTGAEPSLAGGDAGTDDVVLDVVVETVVDVVVGGMNSLGGGATVEVVDGVVFCS